MDVEQIRQQAQDENTAPEILAELANSEDKLTRQYVTSNPNTPIETLENLGKEFPDEITANPIFDLLLLENPESKFVLLFLARASTTPEEKLNELAYHQDNNIREAIVKNSKTPANILDNIFENNRYRLPSKIFLENKNTKNVILEEIVINTYSYNQDIHNLILDHPNASQTTIEISKLYNGDLNIPNRILEKLANHKNFRVRHRVARYPHTPAEILSKLSLDNDRNIRASVAAHHKVLQATLNELVKDVCHHVRAAIAIREDISEQIAMILAHDTFDYVREQLAKNPKTSKNIINILVEDVHHRVRAAIAVREDISEEITMILAHDISDYVREQLVTNPNISTRVIQLLKENLESSVYISRTVAVDNRLTPKELKKITKTYIPEETANKIAENNSNYVRRLIAINPNISIDLISKLSRDNESCVRLGVAKNINTSPKILQILASDTDYLVRQAVADHPNITKKTLDKLKNDNNVNVREQVAKNPNISLATIEYLAKDSIAIVRQAIANNSQTSATILDKLKSDC